MNQCFIARKPLLDRNKNIAAYEILFRDMNGLRPDLAPGYHPVKRLPYF